MNPESNSLPIVRQVQGLRQRVAQWRSEGHTVALVPTMGALHDGHLHLMQRALTMADRALATIFVNPTQFGEGEDFSAYPRQEQDDWAKLNEAGVHLLYAPSPDEMYPDGFATEISVSGVTDDLEGAHRPGHFNGVATVVTKLLLQTVPDHALFGEKDWQQLAVIRRMRKDLNIPVDIIGVPTVREADGLALSSRNAYLSEKERAAASGLYRQLRAVAKVARDGGDWEQAAHDATEALILSGFSVIDYVTVRHAETLTDWKQGDPGRVLAAATLGKARLIDNIDVAEDA